MKKYLLYSILFIICLSILLTFIFYPRIKLNKQDIVLNVNEKYKEPGFKVYNLIDKYNDKVKIKSNLNNKKLGIYEITYSYKLLFFKQSKTRKITVVDRKKPIIKLEYDNEEICKNKYKNYKYSATDNYDGDITDKVKIEIEDNRLIYKVKDSSDNERILIKEVKFISDNEPTIELKGASTVNIYQGTEYRELGYEAFDKCDGNLTDKVKIEGSVDKNKVGTYTIKYTVLNSDEKVKTVTRKVNIKQRETVKSGAGNGKIYLTFDDGPSSNVTPKILDTLKQEDVKATFFLINHSDDLNYLIKKEFDEGHALALHTASHNYSYIYASEENFWNDLIKIEDKIKNITGYDSKIFRFPGGSSNTISKKHKVGIMTALALQATDRNYIYFDWNVDSEDAAGKKSSEQICNNVTSRLSKNKTNVVLMHDSSTKETTAEALKCIITYGKENEYVFEKITNETPRVVHHINN